jgi:hypothetical protein
MKKLGLGLLIGFITACGGSGDRAENLRDSARYMQRYMRWQERIKKTEQESKQKRQARFKKGDTLAIQPQKLKDYLPTKILGFQTEGHLIDNPSNFSGKAFSSVEQGYIKGNQHLRITITDHNGKTAPDYADMLAIWRETIFQDSRREYSAGVLIQKNIKSWAYFHKRKRRAELTLLVSDRITVSIMADNQANTELLREIAEQMDLQILSKK